MARSGDWIRSYGQITLTGLSDLEEVILDQGTPVDDATLVRVIGSLTWNLEPNQFTGRSRLWAGLLVTGFDSLDPRIPNVTGATSWSWWDHFAMAPHNELGAQSSDFRYGPAYRYQSFDVHGFRILRPVSSNQEIRFYAAQDTIGDPPAAINCFFSLAYFILQP